MIMRTSVSILEREGLLRDALERILTAAGLRVIESHREPEPFLAGLRANMPAVAVLSLTSGDAQDLSLVSVLRSAHPMLGLTVLSPCLDEEAPRRFFLAGAAAVLAKSSASCTALVETIEQVARGERGQVIFHGLPVNRPARSAGARVLSPREREVLSFFASGYDNLKISALLGITERTVKAHVSNLYRKLGLENRTQLALYAVRLGIRPRQEV
jgi:two-component system, NarL family, nitrate/nitrite response regulator NarL